MHRQGTLYYNPKCGTCRKVADALKARGVRVQLVEYLKTPPTPQELDSLLKKMGTGPESILRTKEPLFQEKFADKNFSRQEWLKVLHENPILIERPILVMDNRAAVIRPAEKLNDFLSL